ncbi:NAD(P)H-dependent flavin oxidoreductase YrpB, nitropropane dioxygenase family [Raineyella antarctica]|uniref:NAD(P)H-dependent flavin oxidoreductase YrpB, nitropropane dioxygenase family n=2 Tax=Raineyella antarctica TaxID=1577474 RepID=A0A1G6ICC5_9ACTN|nr:NAD(P)H-dependent flavin oxidoreductase YrpB, nitropropane dioxygenase family [Raineyella antarctica]
MTVEQTAVVTRPVIIQGGMGVAVSSWQLARQVSLTGQLGVVSGTALDSVVARRLQDGDEGGHIRRALAHFPSPAMASRVLDRYFREGGRDGAAYRPQLPLGLNPRPAAIELALVGNFAEVWLAKEGHDGVVGINLLEKIQTATLSAVLGAMLAGVDYVLMGAGIPREIPQLLNNFAAGLPGELTIDVADATRPYIASLDPVELLGDALPELKRPQFLAIVSLHVLAAFLNRSEQFRPDGFIVEGPLAGGHSAPPRGKMALDDAGQPVYGLRDNADLAAMTAIGLPFWLAGAYGTPERVADAVAAGAVGVQVGTLFAFAEESGLRTDLRSGLLHSLNQDSGQVRNDPRASPTGFPFKIANVEGSLSEPETYAARERICDLGFLRTPVEREDGRLTYRCAAEPEQMYVKKGGEAADTIGRMCLCNALLADIGLGQMRKSGYVEQPAITLGQDLSGPERLAETRPDGWTAAEAVEWLTSSLA